MPSSSREPLSCSPPTGAELPKMNGTPAIQTPKLGRGISEGDDVLLFDKSPPPRPKLSALAEAKKVAAMRYLYHWNVHSERHGWSFKHDVPVARKDKSPHACLWVMTIRVERILNDNGCRHSAINLIQPLSPFCFLSGCRR